MIPPLHSEPPKIECPRCHHRFLVHDNGPAWLTFSILGAIILAIVFGLWFLAFVLDDAGRSYHQYCADSGQAVIQFFLRFK